MKIPRIEVFVVCYNRPMTFKKALCIILGVPLFLIGIGISAIFIFVGNIELGDKILAVCIGLSMAVFGWWLLRRGSNSVWDALGWILFHIIP
jgi:cytochrome c biogenesis protein CcdA